MAEALTELIINGVTLSTSLAQNLCATVLGKPVAIKDIKIVGTGAHGTAVKVQTEADGDLILKLIRDGTSLGHDYVADRLKTLLNAHIASDQVCPGISLGVVLLQNDSSLHLITAPAEAVGVLRLFPAPQTLAHQIGSLGRSLTDMQRSFFLMLQDEFVRIHSTSPSTEQAVHIHHRKLREVLGHSHYLLGILDSYGTYQEFGRAKQFEYASKLLEARYALIDDTPSITQIHGDPHFGNILLANSRIHLVDPGGGQYGHPAEDLACAIVDLLLWSVVRYGLLTGGYQEAMSIVLDEYVDRTARKEIFQYIPLYLGSKIPVVVHPHFFPKVSTQTREVLLSIGSKILSQPSLSTGSLVEIVTAHV